MQVIYAIGSQHRDNEIAERVARLIEIVGEHEKVTGFFADGLRADSIGGLTSVIDSMSSLSDGKRVEYLRKLTKINRRIAEGIELLKTFASLRSKGIDIKPYVTEIDYIDDSARLAEEDAPGCVRSIYAQVQARNITEQEAFCLLDQHILRRRDFYMHRNIKKQGLPKNILTVGLLHTLEPIQNDPNMRLYRVNFGIINGSRLKTKYIERNVLEGNLPSSLKEDVDQFLKNSCLTNNVKYEE